MAGTWNFSVAFSFMAVINVQLNDPRGDPRLYGKMM
jgi:hypothetical protein